jgi:hypothetical protein
VFKDFLLRIICLEKFGNVFLGLGKLELSVIVCVFCENRVDQTLLVHSYSELDLTVRLMFSSNLLE